MHVQINESRSNNQPFGVKFLIGAAPDFIRRSNFGDLPIAQQNIHQSINLGHWIDYPSTANQE
jgi:hypothetical protein